MFKFFPQKNKISNNLGAIPEKLSYLKMYKLVSWNILEAISSIGTCISTKNATVVAESLLHLLARRY